MGFGLWQFQALQKTQELSLDRATTLSQFSQEAVVQGIAAMRASAPLLEDADQQLDAAAVQQSLDLWAAFVARIGKLQSSDQTNSLVDMAEQATSAFSRLSELMMGRQALKDALFQRFSSVGTAGAELENTLVPYAEILRRKSINTINRMAASSEVDTLGLLGIKSSLVQYQAINELKTLTRNMITGISLLKSFPGEEQTKAIQSHLERDLRFFFDIISNFRLDRSEEAQRILAAAKVFSDALRGEMEEFSDFSEVFRLDREIDGGRIAYKQQVGQVENQLLTGLQANVGEVAQAEASLGEEIGRALVFFGVVAGAAFLIGGFVVFTRPNGSSV
ncbi:MAG: hypothetical protein AAF530_17110 [Pseudomonadota bacterium]